jgi:hypothetical protein
MQLASQQHDQPSGVDNKSGASEHRESAWSLQIARFHHRVSLVALVGLV